MPWATSKGGDFMEQLKVIIVIVALALGGVTVPGSAQAQEVERRWEHTEKAYGDMTIADKIGSNARKGFVGLIDSVAQGAFSAFAIGAPTGGFLARKVLTVAGDVVGLVDNNVATKHVTQGILSRQLLRFGTGAKGMPNALGNIHDTKFEAPALELEDYVGNQTFHTKAYIQPSALASVGAVVVSNLLVRPAGSLITIFGARSQGEAMNEWGVDLIERSLKAKGL